MAQEGREQRLLADIPLKPGTRHAILPGNARLQTWLAK
jgi:hypothetical protein